MSVADTIRRLAGPSKAERLETLESLSCDKNEVNCDIFKILIDIERVPSSITQYRDRERYLEHLLKALYTEQQDRSESTQVYTFSYLLGSLYVNFEKFWGPTIRVIVEILSRSKIKNLLLNELLNHLIRTSDYIYCGATPTNQDTNDDRPDHVLHRNFIFQLMSKFPSYYESTSVQFMDQFFLFVHKELQVSPFIEKFSSSDLTQRKTNSDGDEENIDDVVQEVTSEDKQKRKRHKTHHKKVKISNALIAKRKSRETFITVAKVIQSFKNIGRIHRCSELKKLILDLLCCRDMSVQKAAFNCLLAFNVGELKPYIDKLLKILHEKKVRSELSVFSIDAEESDQVRKEHRPQLIPILQRILFGRMIGQVGKKSAGHSKAETRKALVMRFIAGCTTDEIMNFFSLLFDPLFSFVDIPYSEIAIRLDEKLDIKNYVPLSKLQAMLKSLSAYMETVAHLKEDSLSCVFKLINIVIYYVTQPLNNSKLLEQINPAHLTSLKALRRDCIQISADFFRSFEYYQFQQDELDFTFEFLIWPCTVGFIDKNHATITPILKLLQAFTSNRVYHQLLVKRNKANVEEYLLRHIMLLYQDPKVTRPVLKFIASMIADLLHPERGLDDRDDDVTLDHAHSSLQMLQDSDAVIPDVDSAMYIAPELSLSYGHQIIMSFTPIIFETLRKSCEEFAGKKDTDFRLDADELLILATLSKYLGESEQCLLATKLLIGTLSHLKKEQLIIDTLKTTQELMRHVVGSIDPMIIASVADILSYQRNTEQRRELCNLIEVLAKIDANLQVASHVILLMNTMRADLSDSVDLVKMIEGFHLSFRYLDDLDDVTMNQPEIVRHSLVLLIHQTGYVINSVDRFEFSVRDNCLIFYQKLAEKMKSIDCTGTGSFVKLILNDLILEKFIKKGLRNTNDTIKHSYIGVLRIFATNCHEKDKTLNELNMFCNANQDLDFWLNIKHIQLHNRSKALARLIANPDLEKASPKTLSSYLMPLAASFLFNKNYRSVSSLADNSIKLIGIMCRHLNWVIYEANLSYYLGLLTKANATYQRTNIKLITEMLSNFNFDITACEEAMQFAEEDKKLEKRMRKRRGISSMDSKDHLEILASDAPKSKKLNASTARMVYLSVTRKLIPNLNSCLHEMTRVEFESDKNMSNFVPEKEEIKRIPLAYAIVQLLSVLPCKFVLFRDHLPSLFLKIASFLKSKNEDTRKAARATLIRVMSFVGPAYLPDLLRILKQNLNKGFFIHVLNYTVQSVLAKLDLHYGDLDNPLKELVDLCIQEIFGQVSEDKEVAQILAKTSEAKKTKSYDTLLIVSSYVTENELGTLMIPIKTLLKTSNDLKKVNKLSVCLQRIFTGLAQNENFPVDRLLAFVQETIEESIPNLAMRSKVETVESAQTFGNKPENSLRVDRFLIAKDPPKDRIKSKINERANSHMLAENALRLLLLVFEKNKLAIKKKVTLQNKLDGFIAPLSACLKSSSPRCVMRALKCLHFISQTKLDLPTFNTKCNSIVKRIFVLFNLYNGVGMVHGDNYEMIDMCFKTLSLLLAKSDNVNLNETQVRALLTYIEQDLNDASRQATAFRALHSLLQRHCISPELPDIMRRVADLLVTSDDDSTRSLSIKAWQIYLLEYDHEGSALQTHLSKFLRQLDYEHIDGRKSVLKMLRAIVEKFPERLLRDYLELFFNLIAQRIINDDSKEVRDTASRLLALLVQRLPDKQTYLLNKFVMSWSSAANTSVKMLGIKLLSVFLESSKTLFENKERISKILTIIEDSLAVEDLTEDEDDIEENHVSAGYDDDSADQNHQEVSYLISTTNRLNYYALRLFKRLITKDLISCVDVNFIEHLKKIWQSIALQKLNHSDESVVVTSCELYLIFISRTDLARSLQVDSPSKANYLDWNATRIVRLLCDRFIDLLDKFDNTNKIFNYVVECMILLGQAVANSRATLKFDEAYLKSFDNSDVVGYLLSLDQLPSDGFVHDHLPCQQPEAKKHANLMWLAIKIVMQARKEAALYRLQTSYRRDFVLRWTAAVAQELGPRRVAPYVFLFTMTPVRELTDKAKSKPDDDSPRNGLVAMSEDLLKFIKNLTGVETFNKIHSHVQLYYTKKRVERKKIEAVMKVKDQARGVKRKLKKRKSNDMKRRMNTAESRKRLNGHVVGLKKMRS